MTKQESYGRVVRLVAGLVLSLSVLLVPSTGPRDGRSLRMQPAMPTTATSRKTHNVINPLGPLERYVISVGVPNNNNDRDQPEEVLTPAAQDLLDFSIVGLSKTGTSFLTHHFLGRHKRICMPRRELRTWKARQHRNPAVATAKALFHLNSSSNSLHHPSPDDDDDERADCLLRGYKSPSQLRQEQPMQLIARHWPRAKLIVGLRHPVWWFQSLFNFKLEHGKATMDSVTTNLQAFLLPQQRQFRDSLCPLSLCTAHARVHVFLSYLGKTTFASPAERALLQGPENRWHWNASRVLKNDNPLFLYEASQLNAVQNPTVFEELRLDLSRFLGLPRNDPLPRVANATKVHHKPRPFDICEPQFQALRAELVDMGQDAATWILDYLLEVDDVMVSSLAYFAQKLNEWRQDPCDAQASPLRG